MKKYLVSLLSFLALPAAAQFFTFSGNNVHKIIAGTNVSISPTSGLGDVTINATGGGGGGGGTTWTVLSDNTLGVDGPTLDISGLNLNSDTFYQVIVSAKLSNPTGAGLQVGLYYNSDSTDGNYNVAHFTGGVNTNESDMIQGGTNPNIVSSFFLAKTLDGQVLASALSPGVNTIVNNTPSNDQSAHYWHTVGTNVTSLHLWVRNGGDGFVAGSRVVLLHLASGGGGGGSPAGSTGDIQFNTAGALDADHNNFTWVKAQHALGIGTPTVPAGFALDVQGGSVRTDHVFHTSCTGCQSFVLDSIGAHWAGLQNIDAHSWALEYNTTNTTAPGTSVLIWDDFGSVSTTGGLTVSSTFTVRGNGASGPVGDFSTAANSVIYNHANGPSNLAAVALSTHPFTSFNDTFGAVSFQVNSGIPEQAMVLNAPDKTGPSFQLTELALNAPVANIFSDQGNNSAASATVSTITYTFRNGHLIYSGPAPMLTMGSGNCGTGATVDPGSNDIAGRITIGTGANNCTFTFAAPWTAQDGNPVIPVCRFWPDGGGSDFFYNSGTSTSLVLPNMASQSGTVIPYHCEAYH